MVLMFLRTHFLKASHMILFTGFKLEQTHKVRSVLVVLPGAGGHYQLTDHLKNTNYIFHIFR